VASYPESLDKIKNFNNQFTSASYPYVGQERSKSRDMAGASRLVDEKIFMKGSSQSLAGLIQLTE
jgi:hypothetical protein